jgi:long-chain fatty acid transport protein
MRNVIAVFVVALAEVALFSSGSLAAGFRLPDQDAAAMGMAGAFVGQADNPSAVWYNPAGITGLDGMRISAGVIAIYPVLSHESTNGATDVSERNVFLPAQLFFTDRINEKVSFGLGITSPFGLSTDWSDTSAASSVATLSRVKTIDINPAIAYKIVNTFSVAVGLDYMILEATMDKLLPLLPGSPLFRLDGKGTGLGANAGIKYKATDQLNLGLSYRSRILVKVDGTAEVSPNLVFSNGLSNPAQTDITLPDIAQLGASYKASDNLTLNADLEYTWWSTYDRLVIQSDTIQALTGGTTDISVDEKNWKNTWTLRIGGQYKLSDPWKLRAGYVYDQSPVPSNRFDTRVPDSDRQGITIGAGYAGGNTTIDVAYMYLHFSNRAISNSIGGKPSGSAPDTSLDGTYKGTAHLLGITVGYKF